MPQRLRQGRALQHLDVVVGVDVDHSGQHPLARGVDHLTATSFVERVRRDRGDVSVPDADVADGRRGTAAVEPAAAADDGVEFH